MIGMRLGSVYAVAGAFVVVSAGIVAVEERGLFAKTEAPPPRQNSRSAASSLRYGNDAAKRWFLSIKPSCNTLEIAQVIARSPAPQGWDGAGYLAACYALAGKLDDARQTLKKAPLANRAYAAAIVFELGHPVADAGDDVAAGPIMNLVLEFWPDNYQALYHAGMSEFALGKPGEAKDHLDKFLSLYSSDDFFHQNAVKALSRIAQGLGPETAHPGAH